MSSEDITKEYIKKVNECDRYRKTILDIRNHCTNVYESIKHEYDSMCDCPRTGCSLEEKLMLDVLSIIKKNKLL